MPFVDVWHKVFLSRWEMEEGLREASCMSKTKRHFLCYTLNLTKLIETQNGLISKKIIITEVG
ncbi:hypothetical protein V6Z12_A11G107000 [Gossypium hirsutum]